MNVQHIAAFSDRALGGNPAGVVLGDALPDAASMQALASDLGYSETAFACPEDDGWRVRYFAPAMEVPFCGHATIALGAALAWRGGAGSHTLILNDGRIRLDAEPAGDRQALAALHSPPTRSGPAPGTLVDAALALFGWQPDVLDARIPPTLASAGALHLVLALRDRATLAAMRYELEAGAALMRAHGVVTIALVHAETPGLFHVRNPFASGGVYEDPATGAAAAALAGALRDLGWPNDGRATLLQGWDMGVPCRLEVEAGPLPGSAVRVSGIARRMR